MKLILHAPNIHQGGGAALLVALLKVRIPNVAHWMNVDARFSPADPMPEDLTIRRVAHTPWARISSDFLLKATALPEDVVICLGNLPPLFRLRAHTVLFIQNRLLVDPVSLHDWPLAARFRIRVQRLWLRMRLANADVVVVQTPTMQGLVKANLGVDSEVCPFAPDLDTASEHADVRIQRYDFLYVSSGEPHKNHGRLLQAWRLLACEQIRPHLCITLSEQHHPQLCQAIHSAAESDGLQITNVGQKSHDEVRMLYHQAGAFLYPAVFESFGLPLLEATAAGLPIIASEADYVRDLVTPVETFDPLSPVSIARAVKRFLKRPESHTVPGSAENFLARFIARSGLYHLRDKA